MDIILIQTARVGKVNEPAIIQFAEIRFTSAVPVDRQDANQINQAVEDLTGVEIATILQA